MRASVYRSSVLVLLLLLSLAPATRAALLEKPIEFGSIDTPDAALAVLVVGGVAYVADGTSGLRVVDVSDPAAPVEVGSIAAEEFALGVAAVGQLAYVTYKNDYLALTGGLVGSLHVIDVSEPTAPVEVGLINLPEDAQRLGSVQARAANGESCEVGPHPARRVGGV